MPLYSQLETDAWEYLTRPPFGDVDLSEALRLIRPDIVLQGNIDQVSFMVKSTPEQIKARVRDFCLACFRHRTYGRLPDLTIT